MGKTAYADVSVIPLSGERNLPPRISNLMSTNSCQFLALSLDNLIRIMKKLGPDKFLHTSDYFGNAEEYYEKGSYLYDYMTNESKFKETALPPKEAFYNKLLNEHLSDDQHTRAKKIWMLREMSTL